MCDSPKFITDMWGKSVG